MGSHDWNVRLHSSTARTRGFSLGQSKQNSKALDKPDVSHTHPSQHIGIRVISVRKDISFVIRELKWVVVRPHEVKKMESIS
jgi:hypothetical protein